MRKLELGSITLGSCHPGTLIFNFSFADMNVIVKYFLEFELRQAPNQLKFRKTTMPSQITIKESSLKVFEVAKMLHKN